MTEIINDNVDVTLIIDGDPWYVKDATIELSRMDTPNFVDLTMVPHPDETVPNLPTPIDKLIGSDFRLTADNSLISERDTDAEEDNLLFAGQLANISTTGKKFYEGIAYDPAQQAFAPEEDGGSIMNDTIYLGQPEYEYTVLYGPNTGTTYKTQTIESDELIERAVEEIGITDYEINLQDGGVTVSGDNGEYTGAYKRTLFFSDTFINVREAFNKVREWCEAEWWFDKEGTFHFGVPEPTRHELKYITDADAGKTTPPYQSVRVIGSGAASAEGYSRTNMEIENKIVVEAEIALDEDGDPRANFVPTGDATSPVFEYHNLEVSSYDQARSTATKLVEDLAEQQADGTVTVVGFPEVVPMDGIVMPSSDEQPMGGLGYNVYKVRHHLNSSDGFITKIHVAGVTGVTKTVVSSAQADTLTDVDNTLRMDSGGPSGARPVR